MFPAVYFVKTNVPEERKQVLLPKKELRELPDSSLNIFKKSNIDRYIDKSNGLFVVKSIVFLNNFGCTEFSAYYTIDDKLDHSFEYQPDDFQEKLIKESHEECDYPKQIKLM